VGLRPRRTVVVLQASDRELYAARVGPPVELFEVPATPAARWAHYNLMIGRHPHEAGFGPRYVEIDDFTEDFDSPGDYDAWVRGRRGLPPTCAAEK